MFRNYLLIPLRLFRRYPAYSLTNILGLSIGLTCTMLIALYVLHDVSFDRFHENLDRIYRANMQLTMQDNVQMEPITNLPLGPAMRDAYPWVEHYVRMSGSDAVNLKYGERNYTGVNCLYADSSFFTVFSFPLLTGDPARVLADPAGVVITRTLADKIFGEENPLGRDLVLNEQLDLVVTGIANDVPGNSTIQFDCVIPFERLIREYQPYMGWDGGFSFYTFLLMTPDTDISALENKLPELLYEKVNRQFEPAGARVDVFLQPFKRIHLFSRLDNEMSPSGTITRTMIVSLVAFLILLIACFNYINLTTARSSIRLREVGIRKVAGAGRGRLMLQFISESVLLTFISGVIALVLTVVLLPWFSELSGTTLSLHEISPWVLALAIPLFFIAVGVVASAYPSFYISAFDPVPILKKMTGTMSSKSLFRDILVVIQNIISVVLIITTVFIFMQLQFLKKKDMGFDKEQVMVIQMVNEEMKAKISLLKESFLRISGVRSAAMCSEVPGYGFTQNGYLPEGFDKPLMFHALDVDEDFIGAMGLQIVEGRNFSKEMPSDIHTILVNEALTEELGWADPVGKFISRDGKREIIGVVKDFHYQPLYDRVMSLVITPDSLYRASNLLLKLGSVNERIVQNIRETFRQVIPGQAFNFYFLDEHIDRIYRREQQFGRILMYSSILAVVIAGLGLFAMALFSIERRYREIGIRKSLGAGATEILSLLTGRFALRVLLANLLAYPLAWYVVHRWLMNFAYRISVTPWVFLLVTLLTLIIALATVSSQVYKASRINPADSLKYE